ncbi:hypothetical protein JJB09_13345 [Rhizobium sp. KVB221]|uniref:Uncharacterized protein n=1 Tax=Rhizobium setariae TaxID=2801340 RepID=A0A937CPB7_9HYPH|nr:hypothetical protein [Rhizobium setariae]MBL0373014.1 hypothetical protein [Rhizobium setariae]
MVKAVHILTYVDEGASFFARSAVPVVSARDTVSLQALELGGAQAVVLTDCQGGDDLQACDVALAVLEARLGLRDGAIRIIASIADSARGLMRATSLEGKSARLAGLCWNRASFAHDMGGSMADDIGELARMQVAISARSLGVFAYDSAKGAINEDFRRHSAALGFQGAVISDGPP